MSEKGDNIIIVKKVKKGGHGHHGGAWKVAYADFVTAMMAFFLLLWLLNATTDEQKRGIADYFSPASISKNCSGSFSAAALTSAGNAMNASSASNIWSIATFSSRAIEKSPYIGAFAAKCVSTPVLW